MQVMEVRGVVEELLVKYGLWAEGWRFKLSRAVRSLGQCKFGHKQICVSGSHARLGTDAEIMDTILHEIAHALTPGCGHNWRWQDKARELGARPERCSTQLSYKQPYKYRLVCRRCEKTIGKRHRRSNLRGRYHRACGKAGIGELFFERTGI